jgi:hypothetical protein
MTVLAGSFIAGFGNSSQSPPILMRNCFEDHGRYTAQV